MVIAEARRTATYLALFGYSVDAPLPGEEEDAGGELAQVAAVASARALSSRSAVPRMRCSARRLMNPTTGTLRSATRW
jgi:hypothetical protein